MSAGAVIIGLFVVIIILGLLYMATGTKPVVVVPVTGPTGTVKAVTSVNNTSQVIATPDPPQNLQFSIKEGEAISVICPVGKTINSVSNAKYASIDNPACGGNVNVSNLIGKNNYAYGPVLNSIFGDTCPNELKKLTFTYTCS